MRYAVTMQRNADGAAIHSAVVSAFDQHDAIKKARVRLGQAKGYGHLAVAQHFPGGSTWHVQFGHPLGTQSNQMSLSDLYIVNVTAL